MNTFDVDKFIQNVHGQPSLWDKQIEEYSDRNSKVKAWLEIGQAMFEDWGEVPLNERDARVKDMKNKWRHIRDSFFRNINQGKSGDAAPAKKKKKEYVYSDALTFLLNSATKRQTSGNLEECDGEDIDNQLEDAGINTDIQQDSEFLEGAMEPNLTRRIAVDDRTRRNSKLSAFQSKLLEKLDTGTKSEEDSDRQFLLSLLPDYKELSKDEKLDFKFITIQFFRDIQKKKQQQQATMSPGTQMNRNTHSYYLPHSVNQNQASRWGNVGFQGSVHHQPLHTVGVPHQPLNNIQPKINQRARQPLQPPSPSLLDLNSSNSTYLSPDQPLNNIQPEKNQRARQPLQPRHLLDLNSSNSTYLSPDQQLNNIQPEKNQRARQPLQPRHLLDLNSSNSTYLSPDQPLNNIQPEKNQRARQPLQPPSPSLLDLNSSNSTLSLDSGSDYCGYVPNSDFE